MSKEIRLAIVGVGNCASALIQGLAYYDQVGGDIGLMHRDLGGYDVTDIKPVVAFDVNALKVGKDLTEAIFAPPNNAYEVPDIQLQPSGVEVSMGPVEDGVPPHLAKFMEISDIEPRPGGS
jgi:myo-inositol-1-phosphate synthase